MKTFESVRLASVLAAAATALAGCDSRCDRQSGWDAKGQDCGAGHGVGAHGGGWWGGGGGRGDSADVARGGFGGSAGEGGGEGGGHGGGGGE